MNHTTLFACQSPPLKAIPIFMISEPQAALAGEVMSTLRDAETLKGLFTPAGMIHCLVDGSYALCVNKIKHS